MPQQNYPVIEATSALDFNALTTHVAMKLGIASFGATGTGAPQAPTDARNLSICQTIVNDAIRMFLADSPPNGWVFSKPIAQMDLWPPIGPDYSKGGTPPQGSTYVTAGPYNSTTSTIMLYLTVPNPLPSTVSSYPLTYIPNFVPSMEQQTIYLGGQPSTGTPGWFVAPNSSLANNSTLGVGFSIYQYFGPNQVSIYMGSTSTLSMTAFSTNPYSTTANIPFSLNTDGIYTLPANFGGEVNGEATYISQTNRGMILSWQDEAVIRQWKQNQNQQLGTPFWLAVRVMTTPDYDNVQFTPTRRRWELMTYRTSNEFLSVIFPYILAFNNLVNTTDLPPSPISFDDTILAAVRATAERFMTDTTQGPDWGYYRSIALPNAYKINARGNNRTLGYNGSGLRTTWGMNISGWRDYWYQKPTVTIQPPGTGSY
jgi:hypothetical protein